MDPSCSNRCEMRTITTTPNSFLNHGIMLFYQASGIQIRVLTVTGKTRTRRIETGYFLRFLFSPLFVFFVLPFNINVSGINALDNYDHLNRLLVITTEDSPPHTLLLLLQAVSSKKRFD